MFFIRAIIVILCVMLLSCTTTFDDKEDPVIKTDITSINISVDPLAFENLITNPSNRDLEADAIFSIGTFSTSGRIKVHGGYSRSYPKLSFRLYLDQKISDTILFHPLFSPSKSGKTEFFVINAHTIDYSRIRNFTSLYSTRLLGGLSPNVGFAEVFLNGEYYGFYSTIERVRTPYITSLINHNGFDLWKAIDWKASFKHGTEGFEVIEGSDAFLNAFSDMLLAPNYTYDDIKKHLNMQHFNAWILSLIISGESDGYSKNYYAFFDKKTDEISFIRWDGDATFGRYWQGEPLSLNHWPYDVKFSLVGNYNHLTTRLSESKEWRQSLLHTYENKDISHKLIRTVSHLEATLSPAILRDYERWNRINEQRFDELAPMDGISTDHWPVHLPYSVQLSIQFEEIRYMIREHDLQIRNQLRDFIENPY